MANHKIDNTSIPSILQQLEINQLGNIEPQNREIMSNNGILPNIPMNTIVDDQPLLASNKTILSSKHPTNANSRKREDGNQHCPRDNAPKEQIENGDENKELRIESMIPGTSTGTQMLETTNTSQNPTKKLPCTDEAMSLRELILNAGELTYNGVELNDPVNEMSDTFVAIVAQSSCYTIPTM